MILQNQISIHANVEIIFDFISNKDKISTWMPEFVDMHYHNYFDETSAVGTKFSQKTKRINKNIEQMGEIIAFQQNEIFGVEIDHEPFIVKVYYELENQDETEEILLCYRAELHFKNWYYQALGKMLAWRAKSQVQGQLDRIKLLSEAAMKTPVAKR